MGSLRRERVAAAKRVASRVPHCAASTSVASAAMATVAGSSTSDAPPTRAARVLQSPLLLASEVTGAWTPGPQIRSRFRHFARTPPHAFLLCSPLSAAIYGCHAQPHRKLIVGNSILLGGDAAESRVLQIF